MESNKTQSVTFNLPIPNGDNDGNNNIKQESDKTLNYIISRNKDLDKENKDLRSTIINLNRDLEEEREMNDKNDKRIGYIKETMVNISELTKLTEKIKDKHKNIQKELINELAETKIFIDNELIYLFILLICFGVFQIFYTLFYNELYFISLLYFTIYVILIRHINKWYIKYNLLKEEYKNKIGIKLVEIAKLDKDLNSTKKSTDYIYEFIDGI